MSDRPDPQGYFTKVTALGKGFGIRVFQKTADGERLVSQGYAESKSQIGNVIRNLLRWIDKMGSPSEMASASRDRTAIKYLKKEKFESQISEPKDEDEWKS